MKDIRIEIEIVAMSYFYKIHYDIKKNKIYHSSIGQWKDLEKKISQNDLNIFWENLNNIDVWNWKKNYLPDEVIMDGETWELKLRDNKGNNKYSTGHMVFPDNFNKLMQAFDDLAGIDYDEDNRFTNYDYE